MAELHNYVLTCLVVDFERTTKTTTTTTAMRIAARTETTLTTGTDVAFLPPATFLPSDIPPWMRPGGLQSHPLCQKQELTQHTHHILVSTREA